MSITGIEGFERTQRAMVALHESVTDWRDVWPVLAPMISSGLADNIASQGANIGAGWPSLSEAYAARKRRKGGDQALLIASGELIAGMRSGRGPARTNVLMALGVGVSEGYGQVQDRGSRTLPARRWIGWSDAMIAEAEDVMSDALDRRLATTAGAING